MTERKPRILMIIPRGEAVRNFLYSDTLKILHKQADVSLLTVIDDIQFNEKFKPYCTEIIRLMEFTENPLVVRFRYLVHEIHFRWIWSKVAQNMWMVRRSVARTRFALVRRFFMEIAAYLLANRFLLTLFTHIERYLSWLLRPDDNFINLFRRLRPDMVFNCSHIHGILGELPTKIAYRMGIPCLGFIFSWDNLTSRSRIFVPYNYYFVWHKKMKDQLLEQYKEISPNSVFITGTPQFDFHFKEEYRLSSGDLYKRIGLDEKRPFILYTTGVSKHFPEEHKTVQFIIDVIDNLDIETKPQLVVRTYAKGTSNEMKALAAMKIPGVVFPEVLWDPKWLMPKYEDISIYSSLIYHCCMGINAASTVSLELMINDKPVVNLGMDPPGSDIPPHYRWSRHIYFDHYLPVAQSGGVMVAWSTEELKRMIIRGLNKPEADADKRRRFITDFFGRLPSGNSGRIIAEKIIDLCGRNKKNVIA
ncbi:MAG: hypothetical protein ABIA63_14460 [bacterium]